MKRKMHPGMRLALAAFSLLASAGVAQWGLSTQASAQDILVDGFELTRTINTRPVGSAFSLVVDDATGDVYFISDSGRDLSKVTPDGTVTTIADNVGAFAGELTDLVIGPDGFLYAAGGSGTVAVQRFMLDGTELAPLANVPNAVTNAYGYDFDRLGNLFISDNTPEMYRVTPAGDVSVFNMGWRDIDEINRGPNDTLFVHDGTSRPDGVDKVFRVDAEGNTSIYASDLGTAYTGAYDWATGDYYVGTGDGQLFRLRDVDNSGTIEPMEVTLFADNIGGSISGIDFGTSSEDPAGYSLYVSTFRGLKIIEIEGFTRLLVVDNGDNVDDDDDGFCEMGQDINDDGDCLDMGEQNGAMDCDDTNVAINPDAAEVCDDTIDNDCNGDVDMDDDACAPMNLDGDDDGYCPMGQDLNDDGDCDDMGEQNGTVDCEDTLPAINPDAAEICNDEFDNDCDGDVNLDDADCRPLIDMDDDGFCPNGQDLDDDGDCNGNSEIGIAVDCDDDNININPDAAEVCDDTVDNNCNDDTDCDDMGCSMDPACVVITVPGTCEEPFEATGPGTFTGDTTGAADNHFGSCRSESSDSVEEVWSFTPDADGTFCVDTQNSAYDTALYVRTSCADNGSEVACDDDSGEGTRSELEFVATADTTYFLVVDGFSNQTGAYNLNITAGACDDRVEICDDGIDNDDNGDIDMDDDACGPMNVDGDDDGYCPMGQDLNDDGDCDDMGEQNGAIDCADDNADINPDAAEVCDDGIDNNCNDDTDCADPGCLFNPACVVVNVPGTCEEPFEATGPGTFTGDTTGAADNHFGSCRSESSDSVEEVWSFTPDADGTFCVDTQNSAYDTALYVRTSCADNGSEVACDDDSGEGTRSELEFVATADTTYFLVVDGFSNQAGPYNLNITAGACDDRVEICDDGIDNDDNGDIDMDDDACGPMNVDGDDDGYCPMGQDLNDDGDCDDMGEQNGAIDCADDNADINPDAAEVCDDGIDNNCNDDTDCADLGCLLSPDCIVIDLSGTCEEPFEATGPGTFTGDTTGAADTHFGSCRPESSDSVEEVWSFTPDADGTFCVDTQGSTYDTALYVRTTCADSDSQVVCNDDVGGGNLTSIIELTATADTTYFLFVDGFSNRSGAYNLNITAGACDDRVEICDDGIDNDADGDTDMDDADCEGVATMDGDDDGYCPMGQDLNDDGDCDDDGEQNGTMDCEDTLPEVNPDAAEVCNDEFDNDCDGDVNLDDADCRPLIDMDDDGFCPNGQDLDDDGDCNGNSEIGIAIDCDDDNADANPDAAEICTDGFDNDCNGDTDTEDDACADFVDGDDDGYCPMGQDLNDDGDCIDDGEQNGAVDCEDTLPEVNPGAAEVCNDEFDNDCDGDVNLDDADCRPLIDMDDDGFCPNGQDLDDDGDCNGNSEIGIAVDCDDDNADANPDATEICTDGFDNDCDGDVDGNDSQCIGVTDEDGDGFCPMGTDINADGDCTDDGEQDGAMDCDDTRRDVFPNAEEICDGNVDNDCDGVADIMDEDCAAVVDMDGDGFCLMGTDFNNDGDCFGVNEGSEVEVDCDDSADSTNPEASEICDDDEDNDCDGDVDGDDNDCDDVLDGDGDGYCVLGQDLNDDGDCLDENEDGDDVDCDDTDDSINPDAAEVCGDNEDNNCDGRTDEEDRASCGPLRRDRDGDGFCRQGVDNNNDGFCTADGEDTADSDCNDANANINPGAAEICDDGFDNNCDGVTDYDDAEDCPVPVESTDTDDDGYCPEGRDLNGDGDCLDAFEDTNDVDCEEGNASINPGAEEVCEDNADNNCDGLTDDEDEDTCGDDGPDTDITDNDNDNILSNVDNCPDHPNRDQEDLDQDGIGDACDPINDNDIQGRALGCATAPGQAPSTGGWGAWVLLALGALVLRRR